MFVCITIYITMYMLDNVYIHVCGYLYMILCIYSVYMSIQNQVSTDGDDDLNNR